MTKTRAVMVSLALLLVACGGFRLSPVSPASAPNSVRGQMPITAVNVTINPAMNADQQQVLNRYQVPAEMQRVLALSLGANAAQPGATVNVTLDSIRHSNWGPSRMHSTTTVTGPDGAVLSSFDAESVTMRSKALKRVAQDHVQKIANGV